MNIRPSLLILLITLSMSCQSQQSGESASTPSASEAQAGMGFFVQPRQAWLDSLDRTVTQIDYLFYDLPFSMSMTDATAIHSAFRQMDNSSPVPLEWNCPSIARIFYVSSGQTLGMAELHFAAGCTYLRFWEDDVITSAVRLNEMGVAFLRNLGVPQPEVKAPAGK